MSSSWDGASSASVTSLNETSIGGANSPCDHKISGLLAQSSGLHDGDSGSNGLSPSSHDRHTGSDDTSTAPASPHDPSLESVTNESVTNEDSKISSKVKSRVFAGTTDVMPVTLTLGLDKAVARKLRRAVRREEASVRRKEKDKLKRERRKLKKKLMSGEKRQNEDSLDAPKSKKKRMCESECSVRVAVDLSYDDLMSEKDTNKVMSQCQRCYASNRRAELPLQFYLTSFTERTRTTWDKQYKTYTSWDVHRHEESFVELFGRGDVVFLTSDSPNTLSDLEDDKVYVIGGLVDHNHHKGYCYKKALELGVAHAQLPISQYIKLNSRTVLTINHVFEILLEFYVHRDWEKAFHKIIPPRKMCPLQLQETASASSADDMSVGYTEADSAIILNECPTGKDDS